MQFRELIILSLVIGCARTVPKGASLAPRFAQDSLAGGQVKAQVLKKIENQSVCFSIKLITRGLTQEQATSSNWSAAWKDDQSLYHLLNIHQRRPASIPEVRMSGNEEEWITQFVTCAPRSSLKSIRSLVLTPKELPFGSTKDLRFSWP